MSKTFMLTKLSVSDTVSEKTKPSAWYNIYKCVKDTTFLSSTSLSFYQHQVQIFSN